MNNVIISFLIALIVDLAGLGINYLSFQQRHSLALAFRMFGGEITAENGFGLTMVHVFAMTPEESDSIKLTFSIIWFIVWLIAIAVIVFIIISIITHFIKQRT